MMKNTLLVLTATVILVGCSLDTEEKINYWISNNNIAITCTESLINELNQPQVTKIDDTYVSFANGVRLKTAACTVHGHVSVAVNAFDFGMNENRLPKELPTIRLLGNEQFVMPLPDFNRDVAMRSVARKNAFNMIIYNMSKKSSKE